VSNADATPTTPATPAARAGGRLPAELDSAVREAFGSVWEAGRGGARRARESVAGAIEALLDRVALSVVNEPLDVHDARDARRRIDEVANNIGNTAAVLGAPWLVSRVMRFVRRGKVVPSTAVIAAAATTLTATTAGVQHIRVLASQLVHRLRREGRRVDPAFVRRVAVATYLDPGIGAEAARPNRLAAVRLATDWGTYAVPLVGGRKTAARVHRAAEAIERLDLDEAIARFERQRAVDLREATRSD
jgi:hypothetical protein